MKKATFLELCEHFAPSLQCKRVAITITDQTECLAEYIGMLVTLPVMCMMDSEVFPQRLKQPHFGRAVGSLGYDWFDSGLYAVVWVPESLV